MNREIKYRGWFKGINGVEKWVYGYLVKQTNGNWEITNGETSWTVDNVGQFIGVKDIKGVEIYEGDKLRVGENLTCEVKYIGDNVEDYGDEIHAAFHAIVLNHNKTIPIDSYFKSNCIVIGNIY